MSLHALLLIEEDFFSPAEREDITTMRFLLLMSFSIAHLADLITDQIALFDCGEHPAFESTASNEHLHEFDIEHRLSIRSIQASAAIAANTLLGAVLLRVEPNGQLRARVNKAFTARFDTRKTFNEWFVVQKNLLRKERGLNLHQNMAFVDPHSLTVQKLCTDCIGLTTI